MNKRDSQLAKALSQSYKDPVDRITFFDFEDKRLQLNKSSSNFLIATYEDSKTVLVACHGLDRVNLDLILLATNKIVETSLYNDTLEDFVEYHKRLKGEKREVILTGHSLGAWLIATTEVKNEGSKFTGTLFGPFLQSSNSPEGRFMAETKRFKKLFYNNDPTANGLLKLNLNNAVVFEPKADPLTYINSHALFNFLKPIEEINQDILKEYSVSTTTPSTSDHELDKQDPEPVPLRQTNLTLMSYNVKMLSSVIFDLKSNSRAEWIPEEIGRQYPSVEVLLVQELFDDAAERIFDKGMSRIGFNSSKKVGSNYLMNLKLDDGGVKIYSKHPIMNEKTTVYKDANKEDAIASKGAIRITIEKNGIPIHIVGTHLQSGRIEESNKNKLSQTDQMTKKLLDKQEGITIAGGDFNINRNKQQDLLNSFQSTSGLIEFTRGNVASTTDTDFTEKNPDKEQTNSLDYFFYLKNEAFDVSGTTNAVTLRKVDGYKKKKDERTDYTQKPEKYKDEFVDLFKSKKKRKKRKKRRKEQETRTVYDLSDHQPILINVNIKEVEIVMIQDKPPTTITNPTKPVTTGKKIF